MANRSLKLAGLEASEDRSSECQNRQHEVCSGEAKGSPGARIVSFIEVPSCLAEDTSVMIDQTHTAASLAQLTQFGFFIVCVRTNTIISYNSRNNVSTVNPVEEVITSRGVVITIFATELALNTFDATIQ